MPTHFYINFLSTSWKYEAFIWVLEYSNNYIIGRLKYAPKNAFKNRTRFFSWQLSGRRVPIVIALLHNSKKRPLKDKASKLRVYLLTLNKTKRPFVRKFVISGSLVRNTWMECLHDNQDANKDFYEMKISFDSMINLQTRGSHIICWRHANRWLVRPALRYGRDTQNHWNVYHSSNYVYRYETVKGYDKEERNCVWFIARLCAIL